MLVINVGMVAEVVIVQIGTAAAFFKKSFHK